MVVRLEGQVVAAGDGVCRLGAVVLHGLEADVHPRTSGNGLDDAYQRRGAEHATACVEARTEIHDADGAAVAGGQYGFEDGGVAHVVLACVGKVGEVDGENAAP